MLRRVILGGLMTATVFGAAALAEAGANVGIHLAAPPRLVAVPASPVTYAPAVPVNYFAYGGRYYVFSNGGWYVARGYNGPWFLVAPEYVPRPILGVPMRYYHVRPGAWAHWRRDVPPRWEPRWGRRWDDRHDRRDDRRHDRRDDRDDGRRGR